MTIRTLALVCAAVWTCTGVAQADNARDRLRVEPALTIPKPGAVRPGGWLLRQAQAQRDGATARMDEVDVQFRRAWAATTRPRGGFPRPAGLVAVNLENEARSRQKHSQKKTGVKK